MLYLHIQGDPTQVPGPQTALAITESLRAIRTLRCHTSLVLPVSHDLNAVIFALMMVVDLCTCSDIKNTSFCASAIVSCYVTGLFSGHYLWANTFINLVVTCASSLNVLNRLSATTVARHNLITEASILATISPMVDNDTSVEDTDGNHNYVTNVKSALYGHQPGLCMPVPSPSTELSNMIRYISLHMGAINAKQFFAQQQCSTALIQSLYFKYIS